MTALINISDSITTFIILLLSPVVSKTIKFLNGSNKVALTQSDELHVHTH